MTECPDCNAPMRDHVQGHCPDEIQTGERISHSEMTGKTYRVTKWVEKGEGKIVALQKEEVEQ